MRSDEPGFRNPMPGTAPMGHGDGMTAPGSDGVTGAPDIQNGPVIANPVVTTPFASSQIPENLPAHPVTAGMTSGFSDDKAAHAGTIFGTSDATPYLDSGAGHGSVSSPHHPGAGA